MISELAIGNYAESTENTSIGRDYGTNIDATVNGMATSGVGNTLQVRNKVLNADIRMQADYTNAGAAIDFTIQGGGANFQLG